METDRVARIDQLISIIHQHANSNSPTISHTPPTKALLEWWDGLPANIQQTFLADKTVFRSALGYENRYKDFTTL